MIAERLRPNKPIAWTSAAFVILGLPATSWVYWPAVGEAGVLPPDGDTIIIPMMGSIFVAVLLLPIVFLTTWLCLRGHEVAGRFLAWDRSRQFRSTFISVGFAIPFCFGLSLLVDEFTAPPGWHGLWWLPYTLVALFWLASMRGFALSERNGR